MSDSEQEKEYLPPLMKDPSFLGMVTAQFLGAFNDNLFKQLVLLLALPVSAALQGEDQHGALGEDRQDWASMVFALPFILFSGYAGYLSDRHSKRTVVVLAKVAEIVIMLMGLGAFLAYSRLGLNGLLAVLFLMAAQSAFFGPGKYGILPEMLRDKDLPRANGIMLMTTFVAIIFGTATAGFMSSSLILDRLEPEKSVSRLAYGSAVCVIIALVGTLASCLIRRTPSAAPHLKFSWQALAIPRDTRKFLATDRPLFWALMASCMFWLVSGIAMPAVNSFGRLQLQLTDEKTSILTASIGLGIALGAVLAGRISQGKADFRLTRIGAWGIIASLAVLSVSRVGGRHLLGFEGSLPVLLLLGGFAGCFAIPLQVFIQSRPPDTQKGQMIGVMNLTNFMAIFIAGALYGLFDTVVHEFDWPRSSLFLMMAGLMLPVALLYRPKTDR